MPEIRRAIGHAIEAQTEEYTAEQSFPLATARNQSEPPATTGGDVSDEQITAAIVAAVAGKQWRIAAMLTEVLEERRRVASNVIPIRRNR
jgi:hypothetical protein